MAMSKIQFQPGLSLNQFLENYGTESQCEAVLEKARCPACESKSHCRVPHGNVKIFQCNRCHKQVAGRVEIDDK